MQAGESYRFSRISPGTIQTDRTLKKSEYIQTKPRHLNTKNKRHKHKTNTTAFCTDSRTISYFYLVKLAPCFVFKLMFNAQHHLLTAKLTMNPMNALNKKHIKQKHNKDRWSKQRKPPRKPLIDSWASCHTHKNRAKTNVLLAVSK